MQARNDFLVHGETVILFIDRKNKPSLLTVIDLADFEKIARFHWLCRVHGDERCRYVWAKDGDKVVHLHRLIMDAPADMVVEHANKDTLDNRRYNLKLFWQVKGERRHLGIFGTDARALKLAEVKEVIHDYSPAS